MNVIFTLDSTPSANRLKLIALLQKANITAPNEMIILQICKSAYNLNLACSSTTYAYNIYQEYKSLPKTFTCACITDSLGITVNRPALGDVKPLIMSAIGSEGEPRMVKFFRFDPDILVSGSHFWIWNQSSSTRIEYILAGQNESNGDAKICNNYSAIAEISFENRYSRGEKNLYLRH